MRPAPYCLHQQLRRVRAPPGVGAGLWWPLPAEALRMEPASGLDRDQSTGALSRDDSAFAA
jgi:hypothetical protein